MPVLWGSCRGGPVEPPALFALIRSTSVDELGDRCVECGTDAPARLPVEQCSSFGVIPMARPNFSGARGFEERIRIRFEEVGEDLEQRKKACGFSGAHIDDL